MTELGTWHSKRVMDNHSESMNILANHTPGGSAALEPVLLAAPAPAPTAAAAAKHSAAEEGGVAQRPECCVAYVDSYFFVIRSVHGHSSSALYTWGRTSKS